jgi:glycosyltransferase involved in cell wall biosynthesis
VEPVLGFERAHGYLPWRDRGEVRRLRDHVGERDYDIVHVHHTRDHVLGRLALRGSRAKLVVSWHSGLPIPPRTWNRLLYGPRGADGLVVLAEGIASAARASLGGAARRVAVVPGCVDTERFQPRERSAELAASLGLEPGQRVVGLVARLQPHRRVELLLDAFERALAEAPELRLVVVGRGTRAKQVLEDPVRARGLERAVLRAGYRREDYLDVLALFDALVFLVPGSDGSCRAVLESMAMEIPTIASRRGILPETVQDGETGRLVDEDPDALAAAFLDLWRDPAGWRTRGKAARRRILSVHTTALLAERLEAFYEELLGDDSCRSASSR